MKKIVILVIVVSIVFTGLVYGYSLKPYKHSVSIVYFKKYFNSSWEEQIAESAFNSAISVWNSSQSKLTYSYSSTSSNYVSTFYFSSNTLYGTCNVNYDTGTGYINYFYAKVNMSNINNLDSTVCQSAASHEIGHTMGLAHSAYTAVMNTNRDRDSIYTPQTDDINGINAIY